MRPRPTYAMPPLSARIKLTPKQSVLAEFRGVDLTQEEKARALSARPVGDLIPSVLKGDRKSTRLNSSHLVISYAVFCLKKKNIKQDGETKGLTSSYRQRPDGQPPPPQLPAQELTNKPRGQGQTYTSPRPHA